METWSFCCFLMYCLSFGCEVVCVEVGQVLAKIFPQASRWCFCFIIVSTGRPQFDDEQFFTSSDASKRRKKK